MLAKYILSRLCALQGQEIHLIFDKIVSPSIKDEARDRRMNSGRVDTYTVIGPQQRLSTTFQKSLGDDNFKKALVNFLCDIWKSDEYGSIIGNKAVFVTNEEKCYKFFRQNDEIIKTESEELMCYHEEADSRIVYHLSKTLHFSNIVVRTSDTDVAVILLGK